MKKKKETHTHDGPRGAAASLRELVFGIEDGIVSTTGAVIGIAAGSQDQKIVILSGVVIVIVEALSMAAGTYLSSKSQKQFLERIISEEEEEIETQPEEEKRELREMYRERGFSEKEIEILVKRITKDKKLWLEEMITKELRIGMRQLEHPRSAAVMMWVAYTIGGLVPIIPFFLIGVLPAMLGAFIIGIVSLFILGLWKAKVTKTDPIRSGLEMMVVAGTAGIIGFVVGRIVGALVGI